MKLGDVIGAILLIAGCSSPCAAEYPSVSGDAVIRAAAGATEIVITTTSRVAGAIHSLTWGGKEFIDSFDHGRQLQSASNFDVGQQFIPEVFNPTEAGSLSDGVGPTSTSRLLELRAEGRRLETSSQMAFWLRPGELSLGHPARNATALSEHRLRKRVMIGVNDLPQVIQYDVTFTVPAGEPHRFAQFEALTGYMPQEFGTFWKFDPVEQRLLELDDGPGEQGLPVVLATADGAHAMGIFSPDQPAAGFEGVGYGRFRFVAEKVNKWNCVFRVRENRGVAAKDYSYRCFVLVGSRTDVERDLRALAVRGRRQ